MCTLRYRYIRCRCKGNALENHIHLHITNADYVGTADIACLTRALMGLCIFHHLLGGGGGV